MSTLFGLNPLAEKVKLEKDTCFISSHKARMAVEAYIFKHADSLLKSRGDYL